MDLVHIAAVAYSALPPITVTGIVAYFTWVWVIVACICLAGESVSRAEYHRDMQPDWPPFPRPAELNWEPAP